MAKDLLLEIGLEEIPARFIPEASEQLRQAVANWLAQHRIDCVSVKAMATPRRLSVLALGVSEEQADVTEEVRGPARKAALDAEGNWTKAAQGFARSQGISTDDLFFKLLKDVEYAYALKKTEARQTQELLAEGLQSVLLGMTFPKNMRWGSYSFKFVRPIRWLVALFGEEVIALQQTDVAAGRTTRGHRFLGAEAIQIQTASDYEEALRAQYVLVDIDARRDLIRSQIEDLAAKQGWVIPIKEDLLEEVLHLVEYPTVLFGSFNPDFLEIPQQVLITSMREHQRYFPVLDQHGKLLPYFVTVRNGDSRNLETVARGNEKVLSARLADARFFYQEDQKRPIADYLQRLESVVYHEELGTIGDKVRRIVNIASQLAAKIGCDADTATRVKRTAEICKFDLVTQMVYEFPELQGAMGEDYARKAGEDSQVAKAINEHYQPRYSGDAVPSSVEGALVSIADKIDSIVACFSIGINPTGSQDPYALRRQAAGIAQILLEHGFSLTFEEVVDTAWQVLANSVTVKRSQEDISREVQQFYALRVKNILLERARYDVVDAVMAAGFDPIRSAVSRTKALADFITDESNKTVIEALNRCSNLAAKAATSDILRPEAFGEDVERELLKAWEQAHAKFVSEQAQDQSSQALATLSSLREPITAFFDQVMVMAEDLEVRSNRLALLAAISTDSESFADLRKLVW